MILPFKKKNNVTQMFGQNPQMYARFNLKGHNGIDFEANIGTEIMAVENGTIFTINDNNPGYGYYIDQRTNNAQIIYGHLSKILVHPGQEVKAGDIIGLSGNTGFSTGSHLHLGIRYLNGNAVINWDNGYDGYVDPYPLLNDKISYITYWWWKSLFKKTIPEWEKIPIDSNYGLPIQTLMVNTLIWLVRKIKRDPTKKEVSALATGHWSYEEVYKGKVNYWWKFYPKWIYLQRIKDGIGL
jgi:murein DD-endopeptidase MepM/ murein hydrolase activator NlpD